MLVWRLACELVRVFGLRRVATDPCSASAHVSVAIDGDCGYGNAAFQPEPPLVLRDLEYRLRASRETMQPLGGAHARALIT